MSVIPWILTGLLCAWIYRLLNKVIKNRVVTAAIAGGIAYAFRVFLVLGGIVLFFSEPLSRNFGGINIWVFIGSIFTANSIMEITVAVIVCGALIIPLQKMMKSFNRT